MMCVYKGVTVKNKLENTYNTIQYNTIQYNTHLYNNINNITHNITQYIQYNTIHIRIVNIIFCSKHFFTNVMFKNVQLLIYRRAVRIVLTKDNLLLMHC